MLNDASDRIGSAVIDWMVKFDLLDGGNEYCVEDVLCVLNDLAPEDITYELDQLRDRVKALEPFDGALDDEGNPDEITKPDNLTIYPCGYITYGDLRTARRVREGWKVDV